MTGRKTPSTPTREPTADSNHWDILGLAKPFDPDTDLPVGDLDSQIDLASMHSFPASDPPPSGTAGRVGNDATCRTSKALNPASSPFVGRLHRVTRSILSIEMRTSGGGGRGL